MKIKKMELGSYQTNCYIVSNDINHCFVVDPGDNGKKVTNYIRENELILDAVLLTHGHFDHIGAVDYLFDQFKCKVYCHEDTIELLHNEKLNLSTFQTPFTIKAIVEATNSKMNICGFDIAWLHLPGHCPGSSMIHLPLENVIFSGDVLFNGSIGRYDFPGSSNFETKQTLETIKGYQFDAVVYPGHGSSTTIFQEQQTNPYLQ